MEKSQNKFFYILKLLPKQESIDLSKIFLSISKSTFKVMQITTYNSYGDKTRIDLINTIFSREPDPSLFIFVAPEGVDVLTLDTRKEGEDWLFHVIDPEGRYLGSTGLPTGRPQIAGGRLMCFIEDPETGESTPTVFALRPAVEGFIYPQ